MILEAEMQRMRDIGIRLLNEEPKPGADNKLICFLHPKDTNGVLIEFCQSMEKESGDADSNGVINGQSLSRSFLVYSFSTLPVFKVDAGSNNITNTSSSATGRCSTPFGTTISSPSLYRFNLISEFHFQSTTYHIEQFIFIFMMMPGEGTF